MGNVVLAFWALQFRKTHKGSEMDVNRINLSHPIWLITFHILCLKIYNFIFVLEHWAPYRNNYIIVSYYYIIIYKTSFSRPKYIWIITINSDEFFSIPLGLCKFLKVMGSWKWLSAGRQGKSICPHFSVAVEVCDKPPYEVSGDKQWGGRCVLHSSLALPPGSSRFAVLR